MRRCVFMLSVLLLAGCFATTPKCDYVQAVDQLKTSKDFHFLVLKPDYFTRGYPGYLVGLEKVKKKTAGCLHTGDPSSVDGPCINTEDDFYMDEAKKKTREWIKRRIGSKSRNSKSILPTHIARNGTAWDGITPTQEKTVAALGETYTVEKAKLLYNVYKTQCLDQPTPPPNMYTHLYAKAWEAIRQMRSDIERMVMARGTTHIFLFAMGWNTPQWEALANFHDIFTHVTRAATKDGMYGAEFNPIFIGITWPSFWPKKLLVEDFGNKLNDADEIGLSFANLIIQDVLGEVQKVKTDLKLILVGHSLGARVVTRAADSGYLLRSKPAKIDLLVGLEGAFTARHFLDTEYKKHLWAFPKLVKHSFYTASDRDSATSPVSFFGNHFIGSIRTIQSMRWGELVKEEDIQSGKWNDPEEVFSIIKLNNLGRVVKTEYEAKPSPTCPDDNSRDGVPRDGKVVLVDASEIINTNVPGTGGGAHSDIYSKEMGTFIWTTIKACTIDNQ